MRAGKSFNLLHMFVCVCARMVKLVIESSYLKRLFYIVQSSLYEAFVPLLLFTHRMKDMGDPKFLTHGINGAYGN